MSRLIFTLLLSWLWFPMVAQSEAPDTVTAKEALGEVVVKGASVTHKSDRDIYLPSKQARSLSQNGLQLLENMHIPTLFINPMDNSVTNARGAVQLRINGRKASAQEVESLTPGQIVRVEYKQVPGLRYQGVNAIIDYIVRNPRSGGSASGYVEPWLADFPTGDCHFTLKLNNGRSQWSLTAYGQYRHDIEVYREYNEKYLFPDGKTISRALEPTGGLYAQYNTSPQISYSYLIPDSTTLWIGYGMNIGTPSDDTRQSGLSSGDGSTPMSLNIANWRRNTSQWLSLYLDHKIGHGQTIAVDAMASFANSRSSSSYLETFQDSGEKITDIYTSIQDKNWYFGGSANYIKAWRTRSLTAGMKYQAYRNRSTYLTNSDALFHQRQDSWYGFAEGSQRLGEFWLIAGIGAKYVYTSLRESSRSSHDWTFIPKVTAVWNHGISSLNVSFERDNATPSLSQTNPVMQQIDAYQWQVGNPALHNAAYWNLQATWNLTFGCGNGTLLAGYSTTANDGIGQTLEWDGDKLISSFANDNRKQGYWVQLSPTVNVVPEWLVVQGNLGFIRQFSRGQGYNHVVTSLVGSGTVSVMHWGWQLYFSFQQPQKQLSSQSVSQGESFNIIGLQYNWRQWQFGTFYLMPFGKYRSKQQSLSRWYHFDETLRSETVQHLWCLKASFNFHWGHQRGEARKRADASGETMTSKTAGK